MDPSLLSSPSSHVRARAALEAGEIRFLFIEPRLRELLADASPFVTSHGAKHVIGEVRFSALYALELICHGHKKVPDFGLVTVRKAMPVDEVLLRIVQISDDDRRRVEADVEQTMRDKVAPPEEHALALRAYLTLQALGLVDYRQELVDPVTYATPLQEEVRESQLASPRPRPHLRVADKSNPSRTFGFVYRNEKGLWALDFAESASAADAVDLLKAVVTRNPRRVRVDEHGQTVRNPDGTAQFEGALVLATGDAIAILQTFRAYVERNFTAEIVTSSGG